jgi:hypothetical protein
MPEGKMGEQISESKNAEFFPEQISFLRTYSFQVFDGTG